MANLIALYSSTSGCGKSGVADTLVEAYGFHRVKMAKTLKSMIITMLHDLGIPTSEIPRYIEGDLKEVPIPQLGVSPRYLFETLGTKWGREIIHPDLWAKIGANRAKALMDVGQSVVVDDMRFPNEFVALEALGGIMVRVSRPGFVAKPGSISEGLLDDTFFDFELINGGTLADLAMGTHTLLEDALL